VPSTTRGLLAEIGIVALVEVSSGGALGCSVAPRLTAGAPIGAPALAIVAGLGIAAVPVVLYAGIPAVPPATPAKPVAPATPALNFLF